MKKVQVKFKALLHVVVVLQAAIQVIGFPEIGFLGKLPSDVVYTSPGWKKIAGWVTTLTDVKGLYNFDSDKVANGDIEINVSGLFFISASLPVTMADIGTYRAAVLINDITTEKEISLQCQLENTTSGTQMLSFAGFVSLRAGEKIAVYVYAEKDSSWTIKSQSSLTFHYFGRYGSSPGFLITPGTTRTLVNPTSHHIQLWQKTGRAGLFQSLTGLTTSTGKFTTVCAGVNILTANIIFEGGAGTYSVSTIFNNKESILGKIVLDKQGITTLNVYQAFSLPKGTSVYIAITSNAGTIKVHGHSTWSMVFIGSTSSNIKEFASYIRTSVDITAGSWQDLTGLLRDSATQTADGADKGQFLQPTNLNLIGTSNFVMTQQTDLYYAFVHLVYSGNATNIESMVAVSADKTTSTGKEGVYGSFTKLSSQQGTISLSGIFHIRKQEHLSIFIKSSSSSDTLRVHNTSFVSFVRMRYVVSAFNARIQNQLTIQKSGWNEITGPWLTETYGKFSYGTDFSATTGRFTASHTGVYIIAANIQINNGNGAEIGLLVAKNGVIDVNNGLYAVDGEPSTQQTLNVYGTANLKTGDFVSLYAYKSNALTWQIAVKSGFSITYIGPNWAAFGFHAVLPNEIVVSAAGEREITGWTTNSTVNSMLYENSQGFSSSRYTSSVDGLFIVSGNIILRNVSIASAAHGLGVFDVQAYVNGKQVNMPGLSDSKPTLAGGTTRDYYSLSFSGSVRIQKGEYLSLFLTSRDDSYTISSQSGMSVVLTSLFSHEHNQGFLGSKNVVSYLASNAANVWTGIVDIQTGTIPGRYTIGTTVTKTPEAHYSISEPGIYYVSGNFRLADAGGGTLFEVQAEIDSQTSIDYGMYAVDSSPKGNNYNLNFAGSVYLTAGQQIRVMVRTSKTLYTIDPGTSFSVVKLQLDEHFPGIVADKQDAFFAANQQLRMWDETGKPGLFISNIGFNAPNGTYKPPVSGVYITSINNYLSSITGNSSVSLIDDGNANIFKAYESEGVNRTMLATSAIYLNSNQTYSQILNSSLGASLPMEAGWSLYFINPLDRMTGFSGPLSAEFNVNSSNSWMTVTQWTTGSLSGFTTISSQPDTYTATKSGLHFASFLPVFARTSSAYNVKAAIYINSVPFLYASYQHKNTDQLKSLPLSGTINLNIGDVVSFQIYSSDASVRLTTETTRSLIFIDGITVNTEGVAAHLPATQTISSTRTTPYQLQNFVRTKSGSFLPQNETVDSNGILTNFHAGVFLYTTNIVLKNTQAGARRFRLYSKLDNETESPLSLQSVETIPGNSEETLSFSSSMFLGRFSRVETLVSAEDDASFQIVEDSTYTFVLIDDNTGPVICEDTGLNLERLEAYVRISTEKSVTFTCTVVGGIPAKLSWYKDNVLIAGQTSSTLTFSSTKVSDSGNYHCRATYRSLSATTNNATLSVYDPTPSITATSYSVSLQENAIAGYLLQAFTVSAEKFAVGQPALVAAYIVSGDENLDLQFSNASTSLVSLTTKRPLDYEKKNFYQLSITAVNMEEPDARNTTIAFNISIIDTNDNGPKFIPDIVSISVPEDLPVGSVVVSVTAVDPDGGVFGKVNYSIIGNFSRPFFNINSSTGQIELIQALDRETEDTYVIIVQARDMSFSAVAEVVVHVTDVNDNQPRFNPGIYSLSIVENTIVGSSIVQVFASDPDLGSNSSLIYGIVDGNSDGHFSINSRTGVVTLTKGLDYETNTSFVLTINLRDEGSPVLFSSTNATVTINIIDVNDNFAHFEKSLYTTTIAETTNISSFVLQVKAIDRDGTLVHRNLAFSINQTQASNAFQIDPTSGNITVKSSLDYEKVKEYHFSVIATDTGAVPYTRHTNVIIYIQDINDETPYFMPTDYNITLSEFARPGAFVLQTFGYDNDSKSLQYSIVSQSPKDDFLIQFTTGSLYVKNDLDRENITMYTISLSLSDGVNTASTPATVTIHISDENDNRPVFTSSTYATSLYENSSIGMTVLTVSATDLDIGSNAAITYSIVHTGLNDSSLFFAINSTTGVITLAKSLDYETDKVHRFVVLATDGGRIPLRGHTIVEVRVLDSNDNAPYFLPATYIAYVPEAMNIDNVVAVIKASDNDTSANQLTYEIVGGNTNNDFKLLTTMRNVLAVAKTLDYERTQLYTIIVRAFDGFHYSVNNASVIINITDINDHNPVFNKTFYQVSIPENTNTTYVFLQVSATDADGTALYKQIRYAALENTTDFNIDPNTGAITVNHIDYERKSQYALVVIAEDHGTPPRMSRALVEITITDTNDNAPIISPVMYHVNVSEAALVGVQLTTVKATDADTGVNAQLVYSIVAGNDAMKFKIDANTGIIMLNGTLDYEGAVKMYTLTISVRDSIGMTATTNATVIIQVVDVNDNQPIFDLNEYTTTIPEDTPISTSLLTVHATDRDNTTINSNLHYYIVSTTDSGNFSVNSTTGVVMSQQIFNYEAVRSYSFEVEARDTATNMLKGRTLVIIDILDVNDNNPVPDMAIYRINISADASIGSQVLTLFSTDKDSGLNAQLQYSIISGDPTTTFSINNKGVIYLAKTLDTTITPSYTLLVRVQDMGTPSLHANITVVINVQKTPTSLIDFSMRHYIFNVTENSLVVFIGQVRAADTGNITSAYINYDVVANLNQFTGIFHLNPSTGDIYLNVTANHEVRKQYDFTVRAMNNLGVVAYTHVTIMVEDVNESPYFIHTTAGNYIFNITEAAPAYSFVHSVYAMDNDTGLNGQLTYSLILSGADQNMFFIDQKGRVYTKAVLDYETKTEYNFQVQVNDSGNPSLFAVANVKVIVLDYNDMHPVFVSPTPDNITVAENITSGTVLGTIKANDSDSFGPNSQITYVGIYPSGILTVDPNTGVLRVDNTSYFDYEKVQYYDLIAVVQDKGTPHLTSTKTIRLIITNVNDNNPYFVNAYYNVSIPEVAPVGSLVVPLHAMDSDLGIPGTISSYTIISGNTSKFRIDNTGKILLDGHLTYSVQNSYTLVVNATDAGIPSRTAQAIIHINVLHVSRQQPTFLASYYYKTIAENIAFGQNLLQVSATSAEAVSGPLEYSIVTNNITKYFSIENTTGIIRNLLSFDYEMVRSYSFMVQVEDKHNQRTGIAHVIIDITDVNDNTPVFTTTDLSYNISEATPIGALVISLAAADNDSTTNSMLQYSAVAGNGMNKFTVEADGKIYLSNLVDSKVRNNYTLTVKVEDMGSPRLYSNITIMIYIQPASVVHLSQPTFNQTEYIKYVDEGILMTPLLTVLATNSPIISSITYQIMGVSTETSPFAISSSSGAIDLNTRLDFEVKNMYRFKVRATNSEGRYSEAVVIVYVRDVNDNRPYFMPSMYTHEISEYTPAGRIILQLMTKDNDTSASNGPYMYNILDGNSAGKFNVSNTGVIRLANMVDYETMVGTSFTLTISVSEGGNPSISNASVTIHIRNQNDLRPVFSHSIYIFNVSEAAVPGVSVGMLNATDADRVSPSNQIEFSLVTTNNDFALSKDGNLTVNRSLDYEKVKSYEFVAVAMDAGGPSLRATAIIKINVIDVNEEKPYFKVTSYSANISEAFPVYGTVLTVKAYDDDTGIGGMITYSINDTTATFTVDASGNVKLLKRLNYESVQNYTMMIDATDGGGNKAMTSATVFIQITEVNDHEPVFGAMYYTFEVMENATLDTHIGQVMATDSDRIYNVVTYSIDSNPDSGNFSILNNGTISLASRLNHEAIKSYNFMVTATDNGMPNLRGSAMVTVITRNVNDNAPMFMNQCTNTISEMSPVEMIVLTCKATDKDMDTLTYSISNSSLFTVDNNGVITLTGFLDYNAMSSHNLTLTASDGIHQTNTTVRIYLTTGGICRPLFNQSLYIASIREDSHITTTVLTVLANDPRNRTLTYSMDSSSDFQINPSTGVITTKSLLDYQAKPTYMFKVYAAGGSSIAESVVIVNLIDINNKVPIPGQISYTVQISEKAAIGAIVIGINATDPDLNSRLAYSIKSGNILDSFRVDTSGRIRVNKALDYELLPTYTLLVGVNDGIHETTVRVVVNVVDVFEPVTCSPCLACPFVSTYDFSKPAYMAPLSENTTSGAVIATVELNQAAKNRLIVGNYSIQDAKAMMYFEVNQTTGQVTLKNVLDAATLLSLRKYSFTVYNQFQCRKAAAEIVLDNRLTGCPFAFSKNHYEASLYENHPINQVFLTVQTMPASSSAVYSIVENAATVMFDINAGTGGISLKTSLDYETNKRHQFTVMVNVTNLISYTSVIVDVLDVNDNCPVVVVMGGTYYQPVQPGAIVGVVGVNDTDSFKNHTYAITSGDTLGNFSISNLGVVTAQTVITSTNRNIFNLVISISDGVCPAVSKTLTVTVDKDVPPPCPTPPSCYNYTCAPCATTQPLTKCPDKFCPGCPICPTTRAACPTTATTTACPVKTCPTCPSTCPATVTCPVCPTLHCPACRAFTTYIFKQPYYSVDVYENTTAPKDLLTVSISGGLVATYSIVESNATTYFHIDPSSGKISMKVALSYTQQMSHRFTVRATIGSEYSEATVVINVLDVNDNCPVFAHVETNTRLTTPVESGTIVAINRATDVDTGPALTYSITAGDSADEFAIDNMGVIRTKKRVIIAGSKTFNLTISVTDGVCAVKAHAIIIIHLDTMFTVTPSKCPVFCPACPVCTGAPVVATTACPVTCAPCLAPANYMFGLSHYWTALLENTTYVHAILTVRLGGSASANFSILEANALQFFNISRTTGEIYLIQVLDYEQMIRHNFTVRATFTGGITSDVAVSIYVTNINDNHPYFHSLSIATAIHEYTSTGTPVAQVKASDVDYPNSVRFSIASGNTHTLFGINAMDGMITLLKTPYLFTENTYNLMIAAQDTGGLQAGYQATVTVNIIRLTATQSGCFPFGSSAYIMKSIAENVPIGTVVTNLTPMPVASNRNIMYSIKNLDGQTYFQINSTTGQIKTKALLNHEKQIMHTIMVNAHDPVTNITTIAFVVVNVTNVNEHNIVFTAPSSVVVSELATKGAFVAQVKATDADSNTMVTQTITGGNSHGLFVIDPVTGIIRLNASLNYKTSASHMLTVCATETVSGTKAYFNITVSVKNENDGPTTFGKTVYTATTLLNATVGSVVTTVKATDPDGLGKLSYTLSGALALEYFEINVTTGVITLKKSLSGTSLPSPLVITACATDAGTPSTIHCVPVVVDTGVTTVTLQPNYYDPYFIFNTYNAVINENATLGSNVLQLIAADNDTGAAGALHYNTLQGTDHDYFSIEERTGIIRNVKPLNSSSAPKVFFLRASVRDHGTPVRHSTADANITIAVLRPSVQNNTITGVTALTMTVSLTKEPFLDSKIVKYQVVAQEYDPNISGFAELTALHAVSWYFVHFIPNTYHHRRFVVATITKTTSKRRRRAITQDSNIVKFDAGTELGCQLKTLESDVCNGPLMPGKSYRFALVGYYDSTNPVTGAFTEPKTTLTSTVSAQTGLLSSAYIATYWIIGLVVLSIMFFLAVLVIVVIFCYKRKYRYYEAGARAFVNQMYDDQRKISPPNGEKDNLNFYASDASDGYASVDTLKNEKAHVPVTVIPEEFEMIDQQPIAAELSPLSTFTNYETISNNITFEEENPEWVSMDISLKVDPSGKTDPVIITRGEKTSDDGSIKKGSVSSGSTKSGGNTPERPKRDYEGAPVSPETIRISVRDEEHDYDDVEGITKL